MPTIIYDNRPLIYLAEYLKLNNKNYYWLILGCVLPDKFQLVTGVRIIFTEILRNI